MQRRELLKQSALAVAAFSFSRNLFAREADATVFPGYNTAAIIKLSSNENPHGPSPAARKAMSAVVNNCNRYPWETTTVLREKIGASFGLVKENVLIGAGSSELLGLVACRAALQKGNIVAPDPTFRLWMPAARQSGAPVKLVGLDAKKGIDLQRLKEAIDKDTRMVYICNPNNPTGTVLPAGDLESFIRQLPAHITVLLDEAYTEFENTPTTTPLVKDHPNLVVAKTFSKIYGMAGARIGYAIAHTDTIRQLADLQPWANAGAGTVALAGAVASYEEASFIDYCRKENTRARQIFYRALEKNSIPYIPSATSFVYFDTTSYRKDFRATLESRQIIGARTFEENSKWLRLSVGTADEMEKVAEAISTG